MSTVAGTSPEVVVAAVDALPPSLVIPTVQDAPYYTIRTRLEGRDYSLRFSWNERESRWYMGINSDDGVPLAIGIKLVSNWPLLRYYHFDTRLPPGEMMAIALGQDNAPPGFDELGIDRRVVLTYFPTTEDV